MSSYVTGIPDYIPQLQNFQPDLNYFSNVLQSKQGQYDSAHKQLNSIYGTMLNSPMIRDGNISRREDFFKMIDQDVKRISGLDLAKEENVNAAMQVFKPLYEDKYIVKDMTWTKQLQNQMQRAEQFRTCIDPDKCGGSFWEDGLKALQYKAEEFKNTDNEQSLTFQSPAYTPFQNLTKKAIEAAKTAGFNISVDSKKGGYIVTDTNGNLLLNGADGKPGILPSYLIGLFKDDQKVMDVFKTKAYVARKDFSKANASQYGTEDAAESAYLNKIISATVPALHKEAAASKQGYKELADTKGVLEEKIKNDGGAIAGSVEDTSYNLLVKLLASKPAADAHYDEVLNTVDTAKNLKDVSQLRQRADAIVAYGDFQATIWNAAKEYAMGTQKSEMKADPYDLASFNSSLSLRNTISSQNHDFDIWKQKKDYENAGMRETLAKLGIDPNLAGKISTADLKDIVRRSGKGGVEGIDVSAFGPQTGEALTTGPAQNNAIHNAQAAKVMTNSSNFLKEIAEVMKGSYDTLKNDSSKSASDKRNLLVSRAKEIFKGTNIDGSQILEGTASIDDIGKIDGIAAVKSSERAIDVTNDPTSYYWVNSVDPKLKANTMKDRQIFTKMKDLRVTGAISTMTSLLSDLPVKTGHDEKLFGIESAGLLSLLDQNANMRDAKSAAKIYAQRASKYYKDETTYVEGETEGIRTPGHKVVRSKEQIAEADFIKNKYPELVKRFNDNYKGQILGGKGEFNYEGGATAVEKAKSYNVSPSEDLSPQVRIANTVINGIESNIGNPGVAFYRGDIKNPADIKNDEGVQQFALSYLNTYKQNLGEKKNENSPSFTLKAQKIPATKISGDVYGEANIYKFEPSPTAVKHILGVKNYDPTADYSFTVKVPNELDQSEFNARTQQSPAQQLMSIPGQALTYEDPAKGALTLNRDKNGFYFSGYYKAFDTKTGTYYQEPVPTNRGRVPSNLNADEAYSYMQQSLDGVNQQINSIVKSYMNNKNGGQ